MAPCFDRRGGVIYASPNIATLDTLDIKSFEPLLVFAVLVSLVLDGAVNFTPRSALLLDLEAALDGLMITL